MNKLETSVAAQSIIKHGIPYIPKAFGQSNYLADVKETFDDHEKEQEKEVSQLTDITAQQTFM